jgi:hypothetical protein
MWGALLEPPLLVDLGINFFLFFSSASAAHQFIIEEVGRKTQTFLQVDSKPFMVEVSFLLIRVDLI